MTVEQLVSLVLPGPSRQTRQLANLVRNAERIVADLVNLRRMSLAV